MICPYTALQPPGPLRLACAHRRRNIAVVRPHGELDISTAPHLTEFLSAHARGNDRVVLDMRGVSFLDGRGVRALLAGDRRARAVGSQLVIVGMTGRHHRGATAIAGSSSPDVSPRRPARPITGTGAASMPSARRTRPVSHNPDPFFFAGGGRFDPVPDVSALSVTTRPVGVRVIAAPMGSLDAAAGKELRRLGRTLLAHSARLLVLDLTEVVRAHPSAVDAVVDLAYEAGDASVDLRVVCDVMSTVLRQDPSLEQLLDLYPTLDTALGYGTRG